MVAFLSGNKGFKEDQTENHRAFRIIQGMGKHKKLMKPQNKY